MIGRIVVNGVQPWRLGPNLRSAPWRTPITDIPPVEIVVVEEKKIAIKDPAWDPTLPVATKRLEEVINLAPFSTRLWTPSKWT